MTSADEAIQKRVNPGGKGLPVTAESPAELLGIEKSATAWSAKTSTSCSRGVSGLAVLVR